MEFYFPYKMRPSNVEERKKFYRDEFNIEEAQKWANFNGKEVWVVDVGSDTTRYRPILRKYLGKLVYIRSYTSLENLKEKLIEYSPEDLYYSFKFVENLKVKQELIFDIDPENIVSMKDKLLRSKVSGPLKSYAFSKETFEQTMGLTKSLFNLLKKHFSKVHLIYSGRGFHIHVRDENAFSLTEIQREELAERTKNEFPVDKWVTTGKVELIRVPGSLNGLVSRKVIEISEKDLSTPEKLVNEKALPDFLK